MKKRLLEDIAEASDFPEWTPCAGFDKGLLVTDDLDFKPPAWDAIMAMVERRERASKNVPNCPECGTEQVQLINWRKPEMVKLPDSTEFFKELASVQPMPNNILD